ncbi:ROK family transcriptional regulator [Staphylococcus sp. 17KM0847]|uniref:ROK family transcriptional regulator n=1 Tax=Staphylococcus sp. 17KM0847 TaxID=2583989 RepID=UPI0015DC1AF3|nr:ROK family transcriptional regulator [Staphylococcus sp. 17KM0847]QLK85251.1 ROK family transcriptional regulator [Staphylococcus sp. 17KM0847]
MHHHFTLNTNEQLVLKTIFNHKPISRTEIAKLTHLHKATITGVLNALQTKNIVTEVGQGSSTKRGGRKTILLEINPQLGYTVSIDFTYDSVDIMYNYLNGKVIDVQSYPLRDKKISHALEIVQQQVNPLAKKGTLNGLLGLALSIHGIVDSDQSIKDSPFLDLDNLSVVDTLSRFADVPVLIENEANLAAIYEHSLHHHTCVKSLATLSIHKGIGAGIIFDSFLYRGADGHAGEIGKSLVLVSNTPSPSYEKIENICSQDALVSRINKRMNMSLTIKEIKQYYTEGQHVICEEIQDFIQRIAVLIYNFSMQINPEMIYINCPIMNEIPEILRQIRQTLNHFSYDDAKIRLTSNVQYATLFGGTLAITQKILDIHPIKLDFSL